MPVVAIVGRPNVGKSSLLNAMVGKRISIVQDMPGVTRDRVSTPLSISGRYVELVDTGGYGFVDPDLLTVHIRHQIELAMARADLVLFIVDAESGLTPADQEIAMLLRRKGIKTLLVANKTDGPTADAALGDFARLGFGTPIGVSALRERNIDPLRDAVAQNLDLSGAPTSVPEPEMLLAIVGQRNAGKSTLVNAIAGIYEGDSDRVIVSEVPGTTRDSVDVRFEKDGHTLVVIDTAGVRKKRHMVTNDVEFYSFHRAQRSIRRAGVVLMLIDANLPVAEPDKKLAQYIFEQHKPVILVINKWDLAKDALRERRKDGENLRDEDIMEEYREYLHAELPNLDFAPIAFVTAKDGRNVQVVLDMAQHLHKQANERLSTSRLNQAVRQILQERQPSTHSGRRARIYYATQTDVAPPELVLFVNSMHYFTAAYQRFIINRMRDLLPYSEVPIKLVIRERQHSPAGGGGRPVPLDDLSEEEVKQARDDDRGPRRTKGKPRPRARPKVAGGAKHGSSKPAVRPRGGAKRPAPRGHKGQGGGGRRHSRR